MKYLTNLIGAFLLIALFENCKETPEAAFAITLDKKHHIVLPLQDDITVANFFIPPDIKGENPSSLIEVYLDSINYKLFTIDYSTSKGNHLSKSQ